MRLRRSHGCSTCKNRRVKCDERWPVCSNCEKGNRQCPGPTQVSVFVQHGPRASSPQIRPDNTVKTLVWEIPRNRQSSSKARRPWIQQPPSDSEKTDSITTNEIQYNEQRQCQELLSPLSSPNSQRLSAELVHALERTTGTKFTLRICGEYIEELPSRIGYCKALDSSISYLLSVHAGLQDPGTAVSKPNREQYRQYGRALHDLKQELESSGYQDPEALVAATIVLGDAELLNNHTGGFLTHSGGSEAVLRGWGPRNLTSRFSRLLFVTLASGVTASSLLSGRACFLSTADWTAVFENALADSKRNPRIHIWIRTWQINTQFPSIVQSMKEDSPKAPSIETKSMILDLWTQTSALETEAEIALQNPEYMFEVPSGLQESPLSTYYHFQNIHTAETMCHFWKLIMVLVQFMKACGLEEQAYTYTHDAPDIAAATKICRTVEYAQKTKPLGAWYMPLVLPLTAYVLSDLKYLQEYAIWAYNDIVNAGLAVGLDMGMHGRALMPATEDLYPARYQRWWFGSMDAMTIS